MAGDGFFVVADFCVGETGVVVDDGVHEPGSQHRRAASVAWSAGPSGSGGPVAVALLFADVAPTAAVGDVAELGDIDVDKRARMVVFEAAEGSGHHSQSIASGMCGGRGGSVRELAGE